MADLTTQKSNVKELAKALDLISGIITRHNSLPILACVLLDNTRIVANNLEQIAIVNVPSLIINKPVGISLAVLKKVLKSCKGEIALHVTDENILQVDGEIEISGFPAGDMPTEDREIGEEHTPSFIVPSELVSVATGQASEYDHHESCKGVCFNFKHKEIVATNGHFLLKARLEVTYQDFEAIVPTIAVDLLKKLKTPISGQFYQIEKERMALDGSKEKIKEITKYGIFQNEQLTLLTLCSMLDFPDYQQVIPEKPPLSVKFNRQAAQDVLRSCAHVEGLKFIKLVLQPDSVRIQAIQGEMSVNKTIAAEMDVQEGEKLPVLLGLNYDYFKTVLAIQPEQVVFNLFSNCPEEGFVTKPITFMGHDITGVMMPARV